MTLVDKGHPKWRHVEGRLKKDPVMWLTAVRSDGQPQSTPVWFLR
ncbi:MAG TPA: pyridoxamine 5'-phosphate oxidase family protein, partial [Actinomycetota bacterium]|nr:pyridoxamine 5'-phosphate oxidase family protein [Actinomycetota bacterium]